MSLPLALGRHREHDPRSLAYPAATDAVVSKAWYHYGDPLDQGQVGSCTGNAMAQALNCRALRKPSTRPLLTEDDALSLYEAATRIDGVPGSYPPDDTGSSGLAVAKAAQNAGYISGYSHAFGLDHALGALMLSPVIVGTRWHQDMFTPDSSGYVHPTGQVVGGHEYLLLGVSVAYQRVTFLNSWGSSWGRNGRFYMHWSEFSALLDDGGDVVAPRPAAA